MLSVGRQLRRKYPDRLPCIVTYKGAQKPLKLLAPKDLTMGQILHVIRTRRFSNLSPQEAIFMFVNGTMTPSSSTLSQVYFEHHNLEDMLEIEVQKENTFGSKKI